MSNPKLAVTSIAVVLLLLVMVQNAGEMTTRFLFWSIRAPQFVMVAVIFLMGAVAGYVVGRKTRFD